MWFRPNTWLDEFGLNSWRSPVGATGDDLFHGMPSHVEIICGSHLIAEEFSVSEHISDILRIQFAKISKFLSEIPMFLFLKLPLLTSVVAPVVSCRGNPAVDNIAIGLRKEGVRAVRVGRPDKINRILEEITSPGGVCCWLDFW